MRPHLRFLGAAMLVLVAAPSLHAQSAFPPDSQIMALLKERVQDKRSAGLVVGLLEPDGRTRVFAFGDPGPGKPVLDANSVFEIGSITKVFTATLLAQLVQEGKVSLDDPVQKYLPASVRVPTRNGKQITLGSLSEQHSGLPRMPTNFKPGDPQNPYADYTVQQMYDFVSSVELPRDPGFSFEYSNLGVGLLGHVLSLATKTPYEQLVRERILEPLGMTNSAITFSPWMKDHLALGHDEQGKVVSNWDIPTLAGAGALRSTTTDMLKFADANLHPERGGLQRAMAFAQTPRKPISPTSVIGLNWFNQLVGMDTITWHNGGTGGYRTFIGLSRARKTAVVVMTNSGGAGADDIGMHLLNSAAPLTPKPAPIKQRTAITVADSVLARYVGTYQLAPTFMIEITHANGAIHAQATGQGRLQLWPETQRDFFIREVDAQVSFLFSPAGDVVTGLVLHQGGRDQPAQKIK